MPTPKAPANRYAKWSAKFVPATISERFTQVQSIAFTNAQNGLIPYANLDFTLAQVLDKHGITGPDRAKYLALGRKVAREADRLTGKALNTVVAGIKAYFVTAYGVDPAVADDIITAVVGTLPTY